MTTDELIAYYVGLLIIQYATQPNAVATIEALISILVQEQIIQQVGDAFLFTVDPVGRPVDGATGVQLDAIASYRGAPRTLFGLTPQVYFEMFDAGGSAYVANGFMDAADDPLLTTWLFLLAQDTVQPIYSLLDDELYRLTQFRAQVHQCDMSIETIDAIMFKFFGTNVTMIDNGNMTMYYIDLNSDTDTLFGIVAITQSLPRPAGVIMQAFRADLLDDFFGLQFAEAAYDSSFSGFSDAETALTTGTFISAP